MGLRSLFTRLIATRQPEDAALLQLRAERSRIDTEGGHPIRAYLRVSAWLVKAGRHAEAIEDIAILLASVERHVDREFPQCTRIEKRDMRAMFRHDLYVGLARCQPPDRRGVSAYCRLIGHAWWCVGLRLQQRRDELARNIQMGKWRLVLRKYERGDAALKACARFRARDESDIDTLRDQLVEALGIEAPRGY